MMVEAETAYGNYGVRKVSKVDESGFDGMWDLYARAGRGFDSLILLFKWLTHILVYRYLRCVKDMESGMRSWLLIEIVGDFVPGDSCMAWYTAESIVHVFEVFKEIPYEEYIC